MKKKKFFYIKNPYGSVQKSFRNEHFLRKKRSLRTLFLTLLITRAVLCCRSIQYNIVRIICQQICGNLGRIYPLSENQCLL
jgi:hypothetical protein